mmetsp:Transcript_38905/g.92157  ORF Transcript_38905/g.92157 Transcript_38905/m.92157 type:complete len:243 (-) Transcript_38905:495-1223(-)
MSQAPLPLSAPCSREEPDPWSSPVPAPGMSSGGSSSPGLAPAAPCSSSENSWTGSGTLREAGWCCHSAALTTPFHDILARLPILLPGLLGEEKELVSRDFGSEDATFELLSQSSASSALVEVGGLACADFPDGPIRRQIHPRSFPALPFLSRRFFCFLLQLLIPTNSDGVIRARSSTNSRQSSEASKETGAFPSPEITVTGRLLTAALQLPSRSASPETLLAASDTVFFGLKELRGLPFSSS